MEPLTLELMLTLFVELAVAEAVCVGDTEVETLLDAAALLVVDADEDTLVEKEFELELEAVHDPDVVTETEEDVDGDCDEDRVTEFRDETDGLADAERVASEAADGRESGERDCVPVSPADPDRRADCEPSTELDGVFEFDDESDREVVLESDGLDDTDGDGDDDVEAVVVDETDSVRASEIVWEIVSDSVDMGDFVSPDCDGVLVDDVRALEPETVFDAVVVVERETDGDEENDAVFEKTGVTVAVPGQFAVLLLHTYPDETDGTGDGDGTADDEAAPVVE